MKLLAIAVLGMITLPWSYAQERLILNADVARQHLDPPVVGGNVTAPFSRGLITDTDENPPAPFSLAVINLRAKPPDPSPSHSISAQRIEFELRFTNSHGGPIQIPVDPDQTAVFRGCKQGLEEASISLRLREKGQTDQNLPSSTAIWYGCHTMKGSEITLNQGEWITYRGSMVLPPGTPRSDAVIGSWTITDVTYSLAPEGMMENSIGRVYAESPGRALDSPR